MVRINTETVHLAAKVSFTAPTGKRGEAAHDKLQSGRRTALSDLSDTHARTRAAIPEVLRGPPVWRFAGCRGLSFDTLFRAVLNT